MWLLKQEIAQALAQAQEAGLEPTAAQRAEFVARQSTGSAVGDLPRAMTVAGDVAEIRVEGVLTPKPDLFAFIFGGGNTTYQDIVASLGIAQATPSIKRIKLYVDSPGGLISGLFDTLAALEAFSKPIDVTAANACSAAYAIAAVAAGGNEARPPGKIEATNVASEFGSIGVAGKFPIDNAVVHLTSTEAPNKRPDPTTPEGKAVIVEYLDTVHSLFVDAIARGRGTTVKTVNAEFGRGGTLLATEAKKRGLIDKIAKPARASGERRTVAIAAANDAEASEEPMNLETLKRQHPDVYAAAVREATDASAQPSTAPALAVVPPTTATATSGGAGENTQMDLKQLKAQHPDAYEAAVGEGMTAERKRVLAHLKLAASTGATKVAHDAIAAGSSTMDEDVHAEYLSAALNRRDTTARQTDATEATAALDGAEPVTATADPVADKGTQVADALDRLLGRKAS